MNPLGYVQGAESMSDSKKKLTVTTQESPRA